MRTILLAFGLAACAALVGLPAAAQGTKDRVHADSFGNLIIVSASGYKRILVGQGEAAEGYSLGGSYYQSGAPRVVAHGGERAASVRCWRPPHVWHGRSYMYGLPEGVVPQAPLSCSLARR